MSMMSISGKSSEPVLLKYRKMEYPDQVQHVDNFGHQNMPVTELAVAIRNVEKSSTDKCPILLKLNMNVQIGTIYGLVGSSGCGKTTLLSCIIGLQNLDAGEILMFGKRINNAPKTLFGYMPQEVALHLHLSIRETLDYYGRLYGMTGSEINTKWLRLLELLKLPSTFMLVENLSGGQRRRVSLAVTLIHDPKLLILDEPTVGLDPLLRESIWKYLKNVVSDKRTTVILTTHYIEEARAADVVGIMGDGRLIVENSPFALLQDNNCYLLEDVILKLCRKNCYRKLYHPDQDNFSNFERSYESSSCTPKNLIKFKNNKDKAKGYFFHRVMAISTVLWLLFRRNRVYMALIVALPPMQIILALATIGSNPTNLIFGVIENENCARQDSRDANNAKIMDSCDLQNLSCNLLYELSLSDAFLLVPVDSTETAREQVNQGLMWGYFYFPKNHSRHLTNLLIETKFATIDTLEGSKVLLALDMSNSYIARYAISSAFESFEKLLGKVAKSCNLNRLEVLALIQRPDYIGDLHELSYKSFYIPALILTLIFELPTAMTAFIFINDRKMGILDRGRAAGVQYYDIVISNLFTMSCLIFAQTVLSLIVLRFWYGLRPVGSSLLIFLLLMLGSFSGQGFGLLLGVMFNQERDALLFAVFLLTNIYYFEGGLWPIQAIPNSLQTISQMLPMTLLLEAIKAVAYRGAGIFFNSVWPGIAMSVSWTILFWLGFVLLSLKRNIT